jgi:hypothetical protein
MERGLKSAHALVRAGETTDRERGLRADAQREGTASRRLGASSAHTLKPKP